MSVEKKGQIIFITDFGSPNSIIAHSSSHLVSQLNSKLLSKFKPIMAEVKK